MIWHRRKAGSTYIYDGCYRYFFWEAEFNDKGKNQGYNEKHVCALFRTFSQIHRQAERKNNH